MFGLRIIANDELKWLQDIARANESRANALQKELASRDLTIGELTHARNVLQAQIDDVRSALHDANDKIAELERTNADLNTALALCIEAGKAASAPATKRVRVKLAPKEPME